MADETKVESTTPMTPSYLLWPAAGYFLFPNWPLPYGVVYAIVFLAYFWRSLGGFSGLGMKWPMTRTGYRACIIVLGAIVVIFALSWLCCIYMKDAYLAKPDVDPTELVQSRDMGVLALPNAAFDAMSVRDLKGTIAAALPRASLIVVILPFVETVIVCGIWLPAAVRRFGRYKGIVLVAIIFALLHAFQAPPIALGIIFISALIMLSLYVLTKSLYPSLLMHSCWNFICTSTLMMYNWGLPK